MSVFDNLRPASVGNLVDADVQSRYILVNIASGVGTVVSVHSTSLFNFGTERRSML